LIPIAISELTAGHIHSLVKDGVGEGRTIEYKRDLPGSTDEAKGEFLADVSSFANAGRGDLIFGVDADNGIPTRIVGLTGIHADAELLRLESTIRDGVAPRIIGLRMRVIDGFADGPVVIVRVQRS